MKIINIRGTNGSGKTTLVRSFLWKEPHPRNVVIGPYETPGHWCPTQKVLIIGPYPEGKASGGMDNIKTTAEALQAVRSAVAGDFHSNDIRDVSPGTLPETILFEGILISTVFQTWLDLSREVSGPDVQFVWTFMSTEAETCIARVKERRAAKGRPEEGFKEELVTNKFRSIAACATKATHAKEIVLVLGHEPKVALRLYLGLEP